MISLLQTENLNTDKPLPLQRSTESFALGYKDSNRVPPGRISLLQAISFIGKYQSNPQEWTIEKIAEENKIKPEVASMWSTIILIHIDCNFISEFWMRFFPFLPFTFYRWYREVLPSVRRSYVQRYWSKRKEQDKNQFGTVRWNGYEIIKQIKSFNVRTIFPY